MLTLCGQVCDHAAAGRATKVAAFVPLRAAAETLLLDSASTKPAPPCAAADPGGMLVSTILPKRGADSRVTNSVRTGSLADARRSASLATSGRISTGPPISKMTRPMVALEWRRMVSDATLVYAA